MDAEKLFHLPCVGFRVAIVVGCGYLGLVLVILVRDFCTEAHEQE